MFYRFKPFSTQIFIVIRNRIFQLFATLALVQLFVMPCDAGIMTGFPDLEITQVAGSYTSATGELELTGKATRYVTSSTTSKFIYPGKTSTGGWNLDPTFVLSAILDGAGNLISGNFEVSGAFHWNDQTVTFLQGTLWSSSIALGPANNTIQFRGDSDSGTLLGDFGPDAFVKLTNVPTGLDLMQDFTFSNATADVARPVPEVASAWFFGMPLATCLMARRRRTRTSSASA